MITSSQFASILHYDLSTYLPNPRCNRSHIRQGLGISILFCSWPFFLSSSQVMFMSSSSFSTVRLYVVLGRPSPLFPLGSILVPLLLYKFKKPQLLGGDHCLHLHLVLPSHNEAIFSTSHLQQYGLFDFCLQVIPMSSCVFLCVEIMFHLSLSCCCIKMLLDITNSHS